MSGLSYNPDAYRSHTPKSFVIISGQECMVKSYDLELTTRGECSSLKLEIPLDNIDSGVFTKADNDEKHVEVDLYTGYLIDTESAEDQIDELLNLINSGKMKTQNRFSHRFSGFVTQPEWTFGDERMLTLTCMDWSQAMRDTTWERNLQDGETEVKTVIKLLQGRVSGLKIVADNYSGSLKLGEKDAETKKYTYQASGKKFFEILQDCAEKMGKNIIVLGKEIYITGYKEAPVVWNYYYGNKDSQFYKDQDSATPFKSVKLRFGEIGDANKSNIVVDLISRTTSKKGKNSVTSVRYPENSAVQGLKNLATKKVGPLTKHIKKTLKNNLSESELRVLAEQIYRKESRKMMTGNIDIEFANPFVDLLDVATFITDDPSNDLTYLVGTWFSINSITEAYSSDGFTQTLDLDSNDLLKNTLAKKAAPVTVAQAAKTKKDSKIKR